MWAVRLEEDLILFLQLGTDMFSSGGVGLSCLSVLHQVDTKEKSSATYISNDLLLRNDDWSVESNSYLVFPGQLSGPLHQNVADMVSVLDQFLILYHVQHGRGDGAADWVSFIIIRVSLSVESGIPSLSSPPYVLKYSTPVASKLAAIWGVVITAPTGCPLPIGLAAIRNQWK